MAWYTIYVIELSPNAPLGPRPDPSKPYLYVGCTANTPERRFEIHMAGGITASPLVTDFGIRLRPDLYSQYKKVNGQKLAPGAEQAVAAELRSQGYVVHSGGVGFGWDQFKK